MKATEAKGSATGWLDTIRLALALVPQSARKQWMSLIFLGLLASAFEAGAATMVFGLIQVMLDPSRIAGISLGGFALEPYLRMAERTIHVDDPIVALALCVAIFYAAKNVFNMFVVYEQANVPFSSGANFSRGLFAAYMQAPYAYHLHKNSAEIQRNVGQSVDAIFRGVLFSLVTVGSELLMAIGLLAVLFVVAPSATLTAIFVLAIITYAIYRVLHRRSDRWGREIQTLSKAMLQTVAQSVGGLKEIRLLDRETFFVDEFARQRTRHARVYALFTTSQQLPRLMLETCFILLVTVVLLVSKVGHVGGGDVLAVLGLYAYAGFRIMPSLNRILVSIQGIRFGGAALKDIRRDTDELARQGLKDTTKSAFQHLLRFEKQIELRQVSFTYPTARQHTLRDVSLVIPRGRSVAIVGGTGAGKSTVLDIILGLLRPDSGSVLVDGMDIAGNLGAWHNLIGYVPQMVFMLDDTLRRNIALGVPDAEIDEIRIESAIREAQLEEVVVDLPDGLDTVIGERGIRLSGGQRQRAAIARALYHRPQILVLDEATAALDNRTEHFLSEAVQKLSGAMTIIIVAHRLNTIRNCDHIAVMKNGTIVDGGGFDQLTTSSAAFREISAQTVERKR